MLCPKTKPANTKKKTSSNKTAVKHDLLYIMSPTCGWCKKANPVVDELVKDGHKITTLDVMNPDESNRANELKTKYNKIASAMLTNIELLETVAQEGKHTFISTGMSTMEEIKNAVDIFKKSNCSFELMHTNSSYPMKIEEANLMCIPMLKKEFDCNVGYSGHEVSAYRVSLIAASLGATSIERHITLDRTMYGSDQAASLEPPGLKRMIKDVRSVDSVLGDGEKRVWDSEIPVKKKLRG